MLISLARRQRPIGDSAYEHIKQCSFPVNFVTYLPGCSGRAIQEADARQRRHLLTWAAAAVLALAAGTGAWIFSWGRGTVETEVRATLDLRPYAIVRGEPQPADRPPLQLPRGRVLLTLLLPIGSESGAYDIEIRGSSAAPRATGGGNADLRNYVTTLETALDLGLLSSGAYRLALRHRGRSGKSSLHRCSDDAKDSQYVDCGGQPFRE